MGDTFLNEITDIEDGSCERFSTSEYDILYVFLRKCLGAFSYA